MHPNPLKLKICGLRETENSLAVADLKPDFMGFIFYPKSPRYVSALDVRVVAVIQSKGIQPVAVFVNSPLETLLEIAERYGFRYLQLHGDESPECCALLRGKGFQVIKAFNLVESSDLDGISAYENCCDFYLFDTKSAIPGGSGKIFDWSILKAYTGATPFFLSGGLGLDQVEAIKTFKHPMLFAIDVNSRFEQNPAYKNVTLLNEFICQLNANNPE